jgi:hypothetical protein
MNKVFSSTFATVIGVWLLVKTYALVGGDPNVHQLRTAVAALDPARIESVVPVIKAFNNVPVKLTRANIDAAVQASLALRQDLNLDLRLYSNVKRGKEFRAAIGKTLDSEWDRIEPIVTAAGFRDSEQYLVILGTIAALYPATLIADSEAKVHEEFAKVPAELAKFKAAAPALAGRVAPIEEIVKDYGKFVTATPGNVQMVLANKGKIETAIGKLDESMLRKLGDQAMVVGSID